MSLPTDIQRSAQSFILFTALLGSLAYLFSHDDIFRPLSSRSKIGPKMQSKRVRVNNQKAVASGAPYDQVIDAPLTIIR